MVLKLLLSRLSIPERLFESSVRDTIDKFFHQDFASRGSFATKTLRRKKNDSVNRKKKRTAKCFLCVYCGLKKNGLKNLPDI